MCGIVGYIGGKAAAPILVEGLKKLEYRGYDSAGVAVMESGKIEVRKAKGKLAVLEGRLSCCNFGAQIGIGHTRWATHGKPSDENSHPHQDCQGDFAVVHNGIIENFQSLKEDLIAKGRTFKSETDTEVLAHLVETFYEGDLEAAVHKVVAAIEGSYAMAFLCRHEPEKIVAVRKDSPLVVGLGDGEYFLASDIPAILAHTRRTFILNDGEMAVLTAEGAVIKTAESGEVIAKEVFEVKWDAVAAEKGGYDHFMIKEIYEQPKALRDTIKGRFNEDGVNLDEIGIDKELLTKANKVVIVACGTAYHAGLVGKYVIENLARIPVEVDIASEFRYRNPLINKKTLVIVVSQSGETADTLAALREAQSKGAKVLAVTNVVGSTIAREADSVLYTWAGPEIAVASTKAYTTQLAAMITVALALAQCQCALPCSEIKAIAESLKAIPGQVETVLAQADKVKEISEQIKGWDDVFFIGRSIDYAVALEGSLKLKEISYIHAEAYAAGELKHGTLALITDNIPVIALATQEQVLDKTVSNIQEVKARDAYVIAVAQEGNKEIGKFAEHVLTIPRTHAALTPILAVVPLQMLAYYTAVARECDVDKPRNLAKSVTVE
ncbi:glutamine--fructose-6-phosphate transaminase (isomerizing) [Heliobacterium gestii]|uniref:Glutamine--fructose-6-phosphate aminotransferase [isomerizing] n=1 Tax=Heliomicrobium gestii TaxID=2699 RepID=A0A845LEG4_HELGE|nr:glutamine--fructose-6-phosphate transaminase (isomerizing) [Heliomicrobium gestii]MBM7865684.1 glucosamine--fructose-6-phosphate aminotransferase (isomerizing) [Heliomicrobium gestii]MZP41933.1 glutamine--fructose-6-phosphate transaminase (isomerizing) [Heliomicrobium gestii]